jgi:hypothetical protein
MQIEPSFVRSDVASASGVTQRPLETQMRLDGWSASVAKSLDHWAQGALNNPIAAPGGPGVESPAALIAAAAATVSATLKLFRC